METFYILARQNGNAIQYVESDFNGCCSIELTVSCKVARIFGIQTNISYCLVDNSI